MKRLFQMKRFPLGINSYKSFLAKGRISIGWPLLEDLKGKTKAEVKQLLKDQYGLERYRLGNALGAIWSFYSTMSEGDLIFVRNKKRVSVGIVGPYEFISNEQEQFRHQRSVEWIDWDEELEHFADFVHIIVRAPGIVTGSPFTIDNIKDIYKEREIK